MSRPFSARLFIVLSIFAIGANCIALNASAAPFNTQTAAGLCENCPNGLDQIGFLQNSPLDANTFGVLSGTTRSLDRDVATKTCAQIEKSKECQDVYAAIKKSGNDPADYQLTCNESEIAQLEEDAWYYELGGLVGAGETLRSIIHLPADAWDFGQLSIQKLNQLGADIGSKLYCDTHVQAKKLLFEALNENFSPGDQLPIPSDNMLKYVTCHQINYAFYLQRLHVAGPTIAKPGEYPGRSIVRGLRRLLAKKYKTMKIHAECYNSRKRSEIAGATVMTLALDVAPVGFAKKLAQIAGLVKVAETEDQILDAAEVARGALSRPHAPEDLNLAKALVDRKLLTEQEKDRLVADHDTKTLTHLLHGGKISRDEFDELVDAFGSVQPPQHITREVEYEFVPKGAAQGAKSRILIRYTDLKNYHAMSLIDPATKQPIGIVHYSILDDGKTLHINLIRINKVNRGFGYSEMLFQSILKEHPGIKTITTDLVDKNLQILNDALARDMPLEDAIRETPAYKVRKRIGFSDMTVKKQIVGRTKDGRDEVIYSIHATRPEASARAYSRWVGDPVAVASEQVRRKTDEALLQLRRMNIGHHLNSGITTELHRMANSEEINVAADARGFRYYGEIYTVDTLPKPLAKGSAYTEALLHPEMARYRKLLDKMGYQLVIDTSLGPMNTKGYVCVKNRILALEPTSSWQTFIHEYQHVEFDHYIKPHFFSLENLVAEGKSIKDVLPIEEQKAWGARRVALLQTLLEKQLPETAVNESLSVDAQIRSLGFHRFLPTGDAMSARLYALEHQITELEKLPKLTATQEHTLKHAIRGYKLFMLQDYGYRIGATAAIGAAVGAPIYNRLKRLRNAKAISAQTTINQPSEDPNNYRQILYDKKGDIIAQTNAGTWVRFHAQDLSAAK